MKNKLLWIFVMAALAVIAAGFFGYGALKKTDAPENSAGAGELKVPVSKQEPSSVENITPLMADASVENGRRLVRICVTCHTFDEGGPNRAGPNLFGVMTSKHAFAKGYPYSEALRALKDQPWTVEDMNRWIVNPRAYAPGTRMSFNGYSSPKDRADLIAYLQTLK